MSKTKTEKVTDVTNLITQTEAAKLRGVSRAAISDLVKRGRLQTVEIAGRALVYRSDVLNFEPEVGGRPRKEARD